MTTPNDHRKQSPEERRESARHPRPLNESGLKHTVREALTPELREWALQQFNEAETVAGLQEAREKGGPDLAEVIREIKQEAGREQRRNS